MGKPPQTVEVTEEFVRAVDEVDDHFQSMLGLMAAALKVFRLEWNRKRANSGKRGRNLFKDVAARHARFDKGMRTFRIRRKELLFFDGYFAV